MTGSAARSAGGASVLGPGVQPGGTTTTGISGNAGPLYGGGAAGAVNTTNVATAKAGAAGGAGVVIVREYY